MRATVSESEDHLKQEIWARFGSRLSKLGIEDFTFEYHNACLPSPEMPNKGAPLEILGKIGNIMVAVYRVGRKIVAGTAAVTAILLLILNAPDHIKTLRTNYPAGYENAQKIVKAVKEFKLGKTQSYVAYSFPIGIPKKYAWNQLIDSTVKTRLRFERDKNAYNVAFDEPEAILPSMTSTYTTIDSTGTAYINQGFFDDSFIG